MVKNRENLFVLVSAIILVIIISLGLVYVVFSSNLDSKKKFSTISSKDAYDLIVKYVDEDYDYNLIIVDVRGLEGCSSCQFNKGHLPRAQLYSNPQNLYNSTDDILVYSKNGSVGKDFSKELIGHVKGRIYNLEGGYEAWAEQDYPTTDYFIYTDEYLNIEPNEANDMINENSNLIVIDVRGLEGCSSCQFNKGHLPNAQMYSNPNIMYNYTTDILVYSKNGSVGEDFCIELTGHVYGKIYNLIGGYEAWEAAGFDIE